jgi:hypothetical protein
MQIDIPMEEIQLKGTLKEIISSRNLLVNTIVMSFAWIAASFNFYLIGF